MKMIILIYFFFLPRTCKLNDGENTNLEIGFEFFHRRERWHEFVGWLRDLRGDNWRLKTSLYFINGIFHYNMTIKKTNVRYKPFNGSTSKATNYQSGSSQVFRLLKHIFPHGSVEWMKEWMEVAGSVPVLNGRKLVIFSAYVFSFSKYEHFGSAQRFRNVEKS